MTRIDHGVLADELTTETYAAMRVNEESPEALATLSLKEAVLALVEQQRIGNLIALDVPDSMSPIWHKVPTSPEWQLRPDIAAALGVES